jgi:hypothetical protein
MLPVDGSDLRWGRRVRGRRLLRGVDRWWRRARRTKGTGAQGREGMVVGRFGGSVDGGVWGARVGAGCGCGVHVWNASVVDVCWAYWADADRRQDFLVGGAPLGRTEGLGCDPRFADSGPPLWGNNRGEVVFVASVIGVSGAGGWGPGRRVVVDAGFCLAYGRCGWGLTPPIDPEVVLDVHPDARPPVARQSAGTPPLFRPLRPKWVVFSMHLRRPCRSPGAWMVQIRWLSSC